MDGALFSLLFFFFVQISAGVAPMIWPECRWLAKTIFWFSTLGAFTSVLWYIFSNQEWLWVLVDMFGRTGVGLAAVMFGCAVAVGGLTLIAGFPHNQKLPGPPVDAGNLIPEPLLSTSRKTVARQIEIGAGGTIFNWVGAADTPIFSFGKDYDLTIELIGDELRVSTKVKDRNGEMVAELTGLFPTTLA